MTKDLSMLIPKFRNNTEYSFFRELADDKEKLNDNVEMYELEASKIEKMYKSQGHKIIREYLAISDMVKWLKSKNYENVGQNRALYYAYYLREISNI